MESSQQSVSQDKTNPFLENINKSPRTFGHNKYQLEIQDLKDELEKANERERQYDMKLNLFKQTIQQLQSQLQERANALQEEQQKHKDTTPETDFEEQVHTKEKEIQQLKQAYEELQTKVQNHNDSHKATMEELQEVRHTFQELKRRHHILEMKFQEQVDEIRNKDNNIETLTKDLGTARNVSSSLEQEVATLKQNLGDALCNIKEANDALGKKDLYIRQLTTQIADPPRPSDPPCPLPVRRRSDQATGAPRGLKISRRGPV
jgi:chromosome segregation ATPase